MKKSLAFLLAFSTLLCTGCSSTSKQAAGPTTSPGASEKAAPAPFTPSAPAPTVDLSAEIVGTLVIPSLDAFLQQTSDYLRLQLPPQFQEALVPAVLRKQLFAAFQFPSWESVVDTSRPIALAMANPQAFRGGRMGSTLVAVPVRNEQDFLGALAKMAKKFDVTSWGDRIFTISNTQVLIVRFASGYALIADKEKLINGAANTLLPLTKTTADAAININVQVENIARIFHKEIDQVLAQLEQLKKDGANGQAKAAADENIEQLKEIAPYLYSIKQLNFKLALRPNDLQIIGTALAKENGAFPNLLASLNAGSAWGAHYLPADAAILGVARLNPTTQLKNLTEAKKKLTALAPSGELDKLFDELFVIMKRYYEQISGEASFAFWLGEQGSLEATSAAKIKTPEIVRQEYLSAMQVLKKLLPSLIKGLISTDQDAQKILAGLQVKTQIQAQAFKVSGLSGDLTTFQIVWPKNKKGNDEIAKLLKKGSDIITKLLGKKIQMGVVVDKDAQLFALGPNYKKQLEAMLAAKSDGLAGKTPWEKKILEQTAGKNMVHFIYVPLPKLLSSIWKANEVMGSAMPPGLIELLKNAASKTQGQAARSLLTADKQSATMELNVPAPLLGVIAQGVVNMMIMPLMEK